MHLFPSEATAQPSSSKLCCEATQLCQWISLVIPEAQFDVTVMGLCPLVNIIQVSWGVGGTDG